MKSDNNCYYFISVNNYNELLNRYKGVKKLDWKIEIINQEKFHKISKNLSRDKISQILGKDDVDNFFSDIKKYSQPKPTFSGDLETEFDYDDISGWDKKYISILFTILAVALAVIIAVSYSIKGCIKAINKEIVVKLYTLDIESKKLLKMETEKSGKKFLITQSGKTVKYSRGDNVTFFDSEYVLADTMNTDKKELIKIAKNFNINKNDIQRIQFRGIGNIEINRSDHNKILIYCFIPKKYNVKLSLSESIRCNVRFRNKKLDFDKRISFMYKKNELIKLQKSIVYTIDIMPTNDEYLTYQLDKKYNGEKELRLYIYKDYLKKINMADENDLKDTATYIRMQIDYLEQSNIPDHPDIIEMKQFISDQLKN